MLVVRIFIFGLIAIAKSDHDASLLMLREPSNHYPFVSFNAACDAPCDGAQYLQQGPFRPTPYPGFRVDEATIAVDAVSLGSSQLYFADGGPSADQPLPNDKNATGFGWIASLSKLLDYAGVKPKPGHANGEVNPTCLKSPGACDMLLTGYMDLKQGTIGTCSLTQTVGGDSPTIDGYELVPSTHRSGIIQALASAVQLRVVVKAESVKLSVTPWQGGGGHSVTLRPKPCVGENYKCIDIMVGNVTPDDYNDPGEVAPHFPMFTGLISPSPGISFTPTHNKNYSEVASGIQPACRTSLPDGDDYRIISLGPTGFGAPANFADWSSSYQLSLHPSPVQPNFHLAFHGPIWIGILDVTYSKPLCPPGVLQKPPATAQKRKT
jgi:hypothetical protein